MAEAVLSLLESAQPERLATGFTFTEGPLWHPDGFYYFVNVRESRLYRLVPGQKPELLRERTRGGNGTTFDLEGQLVLCEGEGRRVSRLAPDGKVTGAVAERYGGKRFNRPNDVICKSDGSLYFTDPGLRVPSRTARAGVFSGLSGRHGRHHHPARGLRVPERPCLLAR